MVINKETDLKEFAVRFNLALDFIGIPPKGKNRQKLVGNLFGVSQEAAGKWLNGRTWPDTKRMPAIVKKLNVSTDWFIYGDPKKAPSWLDKEHVSDIISEYNIHTDVILWDNIDDLPEGEFVAIPILDVQVAAGNGSINGDWPVENEKLAYRTDWIKTVSKAQSTKLILVKIKGSSMSPALSDGDLGLIDLSQNKITNGHVYAFKMNDEVYVKRLYKQSNKIIIHSDNEIDPAFRIDQEIIDDDMNNIEIIGRIVHRQGSGGL